MLLGGDEFGHSQGGNNNPYCQDSELSWYNWELVRSPAGEALRAYVARLIALRRELQTLRSGYFQHGRLQPLRRLRDIEWFDERGRAMRPEDWEYWEGRLLSLRRAQRLDAEHAEVTLLLINNSATSFTFELPAPPLPWVLRLDSAQPQQSEQRLEAASLEVAAHSVQLLSAAVNAPAPDPVDGAAPLSEPPS
jgi:isoamylase